MRNARVILKNSERVTHVNATKPVVYWKVSAWSAVKSMTRSPMSVLAPPVNNLSTWTTKTVKNALAHADNMTGKIKGNMVPSIQRVKAKRVNIPA